MTIHYMNLQPRYFNYIKSGIKRIDFGLMMKNVDNS